MLKDSISSPVKVFDIHRLNKRIKIDNEIKYLSSRTMCIKFSGQLLLQYIYLYNCRYAVSPQSQKLGYVLNVLKLVMLAKLANGNPDVFIAVMTNTLSQKSALESKLPTIVLIVLTITW